MADFFQIPERENKPLIGVDPYGGKTKIYDPSMYQDPNLPDDVRFQRNRDREPGNFVTSALDLLSRGQYATAAFTDTLLSQGVSSLPNAIYNAFSEGIAPQARLSYEDLIKRYNPEFAEANPWVTFGIGLAGDILLDPTTYLGVGLFSKGKKVGGLALNKIGTEVFSNVLEFEAKRVAAEFGKDTADQLVRKSSAFFFRSNEALTVSRSADAIIGNIVKDAGYASNKLQELGLDKYIGENLTQEKGLRLFYGLGSREVEIPAYKILNPILDKFGITEVKNKILSVGEFIGEKTIGVKGVSKVKELGDVASDLKNKVRGLFVIDEEVKDTFKYYENFLPNVATGVTRDILQIGEFSKDVDLEKVGTALLKAENLTDTTKSVRGFLDVSEQTNIREEVFKQLNLSTDEKILTAKLFQRNNDIKFIEKGVEMLQDQILNSDLATNTIIKNADDLIRYKQMFLDGSIGEFVAENKELQNKLFSLDTIKDSIGKLPIKVEGTASEYTYKYGEKIKDFNAKSIKDIKGLTKTDAFDAVEGITEKNGIIEGYGLENDLVKIKANFLSKGYEEIKPIGNNAITSLGVTPENLGVVTNASGMIYEQTALKAKDGSIIRFIQEKTGQSISTKAGAKEQYKYTLVKSIAAPNEAFVKKYVGTSKLESLTLDELKANQNIVDGIMVDPFGNVVGKNLYSGSEFDATYKYLQKTDKNPDISALTLYTQRAFMAQKEMGKSMFETAIKSIYDATNLIDEKIPQKIKDRLTYLGEGLYKNGSDESSRKALEILDFATSVFKKGATIANPAFGIKQIAQNPIQAAMKIGIDAFKVFDPRSLLEGAAIVISDNTGYGKGLPGYLANAFYKSAEDKAFAAQAIEIISKRNDLDYLQNMIISNPFGQKMNGLEFMDAAYKTGIFRGAIDDLKVLERDVVKETSQALGEAGKGAIPFLKDILKYWKYPEQIEKFYRMSYFVNGFRSGLSLDESAKVVDDVLFNYGGNLTTFERRFVKRIVPFYSFQKNAIPLIVKSAFTEPGKLSVLSKTTPAAQQNKFYDVWNKLQGGEQLTDQERYITPEYIFEQPSIYAGKDEKGNLTYSTFNNYTPFDAINLIGQDENGKFDFNATLKKIVLANVNPYIKMSTEVPLNRLFFNDRVLTESAKIGGVGRWIDMVLPQNVKDALQFESVVDPLSGKQKYYINPYLSYGLMSFPGATVLNSVVRAIDPDKNYKEATASLFAGIQTIKLNEQELQSAKSLKTKYAIQQLKSDYRLSLKQGRMNEAEIRLTELQDYFELITTESTYKSVNK